MYKVVCSDPDARREQGVVKYYFGVDMYSHTEYAGIDQIYNTNVRYVGKTYEKTLVGTNYYTGMKDVDEKICIDLIKQNYKDYYGFYYNDIVKIVEEVHFSDDPEFQWGNLNYPTFLVESTFKIKKGSKLQTLKQKKRVSINRTVDGKTWDPNAKLLTNGIWSYVTSSKYKGQNPKVLDEKTLTEEEKKQYKTLSEQEAIKSSKAFIATLPKVDIPEFNSDKHVIRFIHELMMEGDKGKIEAVLNDMLTDSYFSDRSNYFYTRNGLDILNAILDLSEKYSQYFCMSPKIESQEYGLVQFYTRDLTGYGKIRVFQQKSNKKWRIADIRKPVFMMGTDMANSTANLKAAGDKNCGEPLSTEPPVPPVTYNIGDRILVSSDNGWLKATVSKKDPKYTNRYFVTPDKGTGGWVTTEYMKPLTKEDNKKSDSNKDSNSKDKKIKINKPKVSIKGIKLK